MAAIFRHRAVLQTAKAQSRRHLYERPNTIVEQQRVMQKGSTPYLRGEADPTYLRLKGDNIVAGVALGATALGWLFVLSQHYRMWNGQKGH